MATVYNPKLFIPSWKVPRIRWAGPDINSITFNSNSTAFGTYWASVFQAESTFTVTRVAFRQVARGGTGTKIVRIGIMNVSTTTGLPDGTWRSYTDYTVGTESNAMVSVSLTTTPVGQNANVTRGDVLALVIEPQSGFSGTETLQLSTNFGTDSYIDSISAFPYIATSGTRGTGSGISAIGSSTQWYGTPFGGINNYTHTSAEVGARIKLTNTNLSSFALQGIRFYHALNWSWDMSIKIYDSVSGTTPITNGTLTVDNEQTAGTSSFTRPFTYMFSNSPILTAGQYYYIGLSRASGTFDQVRPRLDFGTGNSAYFNALTPGWESCWIERSTPSSGTFTVTDTLRPEWDFIIDGVDVPTIGASGGGPVIGGRLIN
jgi:hypothetical protein